MSVGKGGRPADVGDLVEEVDDYRDVARVLTAMVDDLRAHPDEWENFTLDRYLEALAALMDSVDQLLQPG